MNVNAEGIKFWDESIVGYLMIRSKQSIELTEENTGDLSKNVNLQHNSRELIRLSLEYSSTALALHKPA